MSEKYDDALEYDILDDDQDNARQTRAESLCPCKSGESYYVCCMPYHYRKAQPSTAEKLMRSRYSAYFFRLVDYLVETTHPDKRTPELRQELKDTIHTINWKFLTIVNTSKGGKTDKVGKVEFIADCFVDKEPHALHELSRFRRYKGNWKYLDGKDLGE